MSESADPSFPQQHHPAVAYRPPGYRETRPIRAGLVAAGFGGTLLLYVLETVAISWTPTALTAGLAVTIAILSAAAWLLLRLGDRGVAVGSALMSGSALAALVVVLIVSTWVNR
ncbi:hypothetical protein [Fodinicola acaciae]|uniref:hypothetical protein n=1 Tax=Fodinicola acaciae TaxID=2681555 RepID=UPI0016522947|nr:hypothetical protein [Fodinicola acaciae]